MKRFVIDLGLLALVAMVVSAGVLLDTPLHRTLAHAQATSCPAGVPNPTLKANATWLLAWCSPATDTVTGANIYGFGAAAVPMQQVTQVAGPFGDGLVQMRGIVPAQPKGHYTLTLRAVNAAGEGSPSAPFDFGAIDLPVAPVNLRAQ